jgi:hypothetical protein
MMNNISLTKKTFLYYGLWKVDNIEVKKVKTNDVLFTPLGLLANNSPMFLVGGCAFTRGFQAILPFNIGKNKLLNIGARRQALRFSTEMFHDEISTPDFWRLEVMSVARYVTVDREIHLTVKALIVEQRYEDYEEYMYKRRKHPIKHLWFRNKLQQRRTRLLEAEDFQQYRLLMLALGMVKVIV